MTDEAPKWTGRRTWRAVVEIGEYGSWSQGGYESPVKARMAAFNYLLDHPELLTRARVGLPEPEDSSGRPESNCADTAGPTADRTSAGTPQAARLETLGRYQPEYRYGTNPEEDVVRRHVVRL